jgi:hypothetical protein
MGFVLQLQEPDDARPDAAARFSSMSLVLCGSSLSLTWC